MQLVQLPLEDQFWLVEHLSALLILLVMPM